jgi:hypothetical protein
MTFVRRTDITRRGSLLKFLTAATLVTASPAFAAPLNLAPDNVADYSISRRPIDLSLSQRVQQPAPTEQSGAAFLGTKLDFTDGQIQLYRFRLDKTPFNSTLPPQQIDAGGIKLKWTW